MDEERQRAGEAERRSTDWRRGKADGLSSGDDGDRVRELRHDGAQRAAAAVEQTTAPLPSTNATTGITQNAMSSSATSTPSVPTAAAVAARRSASRRRFQ